MVAIERHLKLVLYNVGNWRNIKSLGGLTSEDFEL